ncbi:hypothetical protein COO60DRAFT_1700423 [Scenedesmus sp. NREL 46B-D3]|nr:hypothetical protein COO60DRAFT_1700423 [Scenedesmus sp. NREL 46B-D3]
MKPQTNVQRILMVALTLVGMVHGARIGLQELQPSQHNQHHSGLQAQQPAEAASSNNDYYHYQDELALSSTPGGALAPEELEQRNAYVVEDPATGRTSVIEQEARPLPGGGRLFWMRKTAPGAESLTTVTSSSGSPARGAGMAAMLGGAGETAGSGWGSAQQLTQHMLGGAFSSAFAPLNDLLDAVDAQQQRLGSMMVSRYVQAAAAAAAAQPHAAGHHYRHPAANQQHHTHHSSGAPCPSHQALMAAAAEAHARSAAFSQPYDQQQQQQQQQAGGWQGLDSLFSQQARQQLELARAQAEQQLLQEELAASGLALSAQGAVVPLMLQPLPKQQQQQQQQAEPGDVHAAYAEDEAAAAAAKLEALYDTTDDDYAFVPTSLDGVIPRLHDTPSSGSGSGGSGVLDGVDVDLALLVLLVAATAGMCMAFLQSLLQLREALHTQQQHPTAAAGVPRRGRRGLAAAVAGARHGPNGSAADGAQAELMQPLLVSPHDREWAHEQQQQQHQAAGANTAVQRFYNPLCYQQLPGGRV